MLLAIKETNVTGGSNQKPIEVIFEDDGTDSAKAATAFQKLVNVDGVDAVVGGTWDFNYNAIAPLAEQNHITLITPQNVKTRGLIMNNYTFVMRPEMRKSVATLNTYITDNHLKRIGIVRFISPFGKDIAQGLRDILEVNGGELAAEETYTSIGDNEFSTIVTKLKQEPLDAVFIDMVGTDLVNFVKRSKEQGLNVTILSHGAIADVLAIPNVDKGLLNGIVYFTWDVPTSNEFRSRYAQEYHVEPGHSADGAYNAIIVLAEALQHVSKEEAASYIQSHSISTINGNITFKDHVVNSGIVLVREVTPSGVKTLLTSIVYQ